MHALRRIVLLALVMRVLRVRVLLVLVLVLFSDDSAILRISADIVDAASFESECALIAASACRFYGQSI